MNEIVAHGNSLNPDKFVESFEFDDWEISTEDGWKPVTHVHKTVEYDIWTLKTEHCELKCADEHLVMTEGMKAVYVKDLKLGDKIITRFGLEEVTEIDHSLNISRVGQPLPISFPRG